MKPTRFMQVMFSATEAGDEELTAQVGEDIENAKLEGQVDTDEVSYISLGDGKVMIVDNANGECTIAEQGDDDASSYDLVALPTEELEKYLHPEGDGVTPNPEVHDFVDEDFNDHADPSSYQTEFPPVTEIPEEGTREFSVSTNNTVVQRIFSDQAFCERIFSEVLESEDTAVVGNLKIEKTGENEVVVTDTESDDQAEVKIDGDELEVHELSSEKGFSDEDGEGEEDPDGDGYFIVGFDSSSNSLVNAPANDPDDANELADQLEELGVEGIGIFDDQREAQDHAFELISDAGIGDEDEVDEPEQAEFSDHTIFITRFYSKSTTKFQDRLFNETEDHCECQESVEDAIESGEQVEDDNKIITPVDSTTAVVEDKETGEFTKVTLDDDTMDTEKITEEEASDLTEDLEISDKSAEEIEEDEKAKEFSELTDFQIRLYSEDLGGSVATQEKIEDAIKDGEQIENSTEIITPIDSKTAVVEDKNSGEFTKVTLDGEDMETEEISEEEASELTSDLEVQNSDEEVKEFSENCTNFMLRLFSETPDDCECQEKVEDAIESGEQVEDDDYVITPVDSETAVIEDKDSGEFTKAVLSDGDIDVSKITEEEASDLTENLAVEESDEEKEDREFSEFVSTDSLCRFFSEAPMIDPQTGMPIQDQAIDPNTGMPVQGGQEEMIDPDQAAAAVANGQDPVISVENIEDKALVAVQSIQEAANVAVQNIQAAKEAPAPLEEEDLQEAQFSERSFCRTENTGDTLTNFFSGWY